MVAAIPLLLLGAGAVGFAYVYGTIDLPPVPPLRQYDLPGGQEREADHRAARWQRDPHDHPVQGGCPCTFDRPSWPSRTSGSSSHDGVDPFAIARATWADLEDGSFDQGGSTITQQYVKTVFTGQ